ncbi:hypothetical protein [Pedobacter antarcticus]|uniref:hypothetical protein n=1 Tax=Pedobacter antarcticus TaxID=34086 RepID=UPI0029319ACE|nr:hypothetical protein [Pedobacter antarcticus]
MDPLYFKAHDKDLVLQELGLHTDPARQDEKFFDGNVYETPDFLLVWVGKKPREIDQETGEILSWQQGDFFNVWVRGQAMMDFFTDLRTAQLLPQPSTPDLTLFK